VFKASNYILGVVVFLPRVSWKEALFVTWVLHLKFEENLYFECSFNLPSFEIFK
jgi:hypothetical protein